MATKAVTAQRARQNATQRANKPTAKKAQQQKKTIKLTYFYDPNNKQLGLGDYYTPDYDVSHNVYSYNTLSRMSDKELAEINIRKEVKYFSYVPEDPKPPKEEKSLFDKFLDCIGLA